MDNSIIQITDFEYVGFTRRVLAYFFDYLIIGVFVNFISKIIFAIAGVPIDDILQTINYIFSSPEEYAIAEMMPTLMPIYMTQISISGITTWLYYAICESSKLQGTFGKKLLGIIIMTEQGKRLTFLRATARYFAKFISSMTFGIGYLIILFTNKKQALHDIMTGSVMIKRPIIKIQID